MWATGGMTVCHAPTPGKGRSVAGYSRRVSAETPTHEGGPVRERVGRRAPSSLVLAAVATVAGWPFLSTSPPGALDDGYSYVLTEWLLGRFDDRAVVFPYGPLGTLNGPFAWFRPLFALQLAFAVAVLGGLAWLVVRRLRRVMPWPLATLIAALVVVTGALAGLVEPAVLVAVLLAFEVWDERLPARTVVPGVIVGATVLLLVKPTSAVLALLATTVVLLTEAPTWRTGIKRVGLVGTATAVGALLLWVAIGLPLAQLPDWLRGLADYTMAYDVVSVEETGRAWEYVAAAALAVLVLTLAALPRPHRVATLLLVSVVLYVDFKHGFVRHDAHGVTFFSAAVVLLVALLRPEHRSLRLALLPATVVLVVVAGGVEHPFGRPRRLLHQVAIVVDGRRWQEQRRQDDADLRAHFQVPPALLDRIGSAPVDVQPWENAVAFAYDLNLAPVPVVQPYTSFTPWLDDVTARSLAGPSAAAYVLRRTTLGSIDGRYPLADSAAYQVELVCRYREVLREGTWQLLQRSTDRCGPAQSLGRAVVRNGVPVPVPAATPGSLVTARITPGHDLAFQLQATLFKTTDPPQLVLDGAAYRFLWTAPGRPVLVRAPESLALLDPLPTGRPDVDVIEMRGVSGDVVVEFEQRAVDPEDPRPPPG